MLWRQQLSVLTLCKVRQLYVKVFGNLFKVRDESSESLLAETREEVLEGLRESFQVTCLEGNSSQGHSHIVSSVRTEKSCFCYQEHFCVDDVAFLCSWSRKPTLH